MNEFCKKIVVHHYYDNVSVKILAVTIITCGCIIWNQSVTIAKLKDKVKELEPDKED